MSRRSTILLPGYEAVGWQGLGAPKTTPAEIIDLINREMALGLARSQAEGQACGPRQRRAVALPAEFGKVIAADTEKWGKVVEVRRPQAGVSPPVFPAFWQRPMNLPHRQQVARRSGCSRQLSPVADMSLHKREALFPSRGRPDKV